jgi:hypothetical protein
MLLYVLDLFYRDDDHISSSPMISSHPIALFLKKKTCHLSSTDSFVCPLLFSRIRIVYIFVIHDRIIEEKKKTKKKERKNRRQKDSARTFSSIFLSPFSRSVVRLVSHAHSSYSSVFSCHCQARTHACHFFIAFLK